MNEWCTLPSRALYQMALKLGLLSNSARVEFTVGADLTRDSLQGAVQILAKADVGDLHGLALRVFLCPQVRSFSSSSPRAGEERMCQRKSLS
jgi:hypothetical protein